MNENCKASINLSETGNITEAVNNLYESLRWAEVQGGKCIIIVVNNLQGDHSLALWDRITRATSGRRVVLNQGKIHHKL